MGQVAAVKRFRHVFSASEAKHEPHHEKTCLQGFRPGQTQLPSSAESRRASCQLLAKEWTLNTGKLPPGGLPRTSVVK